MALGVLKRIGLTCKYWFIRKLPTCEQLLPVISLQLDQKIPLRQWISLKLHLLICKWCLNYARQLSFLRDAVRTELGESGETVLSADSKERMKRFLANQ